MVNTKRPIGPLDLADRLKSDLDALAEAAAREPLSAAARKRLEARIAEIAQKLDGVSRALDPVRQPKFVFDTSNPVVVGRFVALALLAQPRLPLVSVERFYGSGVYAIYYSGEAELYQPISRSETPIYVGKVDPASDDARHARDQGERLTARLRDHRRSIANAKSSLSIEDFEYRSLVVRSGHQGAAESYLIHLFQPVWNDETGICYGIGKHGDDPKTRKNLRSPWDTLHPGREWAHRDATMLDAKPVEQIRAEMTAHFTKSVAYRDLDQVVRGFIDELKQL